MNTVEIQKAKEAERHRKLQQKKKNEFIGLKTFYQVVAEKYYQSITTEFEGGYDKEIKSMYRHSKQQTAPRKRKQSIIFLIK